MKITTKQKELFSSIVDYSPDLIAVIDLNHKILYINKALSKYALDISIGTNVFRYIPKKFKSDIKACLQRVKKTEKHERVEIDYSKPNKLNIFEVKIYPLSESDEMTGFVLNASNVTENIKEQRELKENSERFYQIAENINEVFWIISSDGNKMIYVSPAYEQIWGKSCSSLYKHPKDWINSIHCDDVERVKKSFGEKIIKNKFDEEYRIVRPDNSIRWIRDRGFVVTNKKGEIERISGIAEDITARKKIEENIRKSSIFIDAMGDSLIVLNMKKEIVLINRAGRKLLGYTKNEINGLSFKELFPFREHKKHDKEMKMALETETTRIFETDFITKDGKERPVLISGRVLKDSEGLNEGFIGVFKDITIQKQNDENLKIFQNAINQSTDSIFITDLEGSIKYANNAFENITGYTTAEVLEKSPSLLNSSIHDMSFFKNLWETIKSGKVWKARITNKKKSGELYTVASTIVPIVNDKKSINHFVSIQRDISLELKLQEQIIRSEKLSSIGTFVSGIAHELNNPITSVIGYSKLLIKEKGISSEIANDLRIIAEEAERTSKIVKQLVNFTNRSSVTQICFPINDVLTKSVKSCFDLLNINNIHINERYSRNIVSIIGDPDQLQQVFVNIIINAKDAIVESLQKGVFSISTRIAKRSIKIVMKNNGPHIPDDKIQKVFDPFFTTKEPGKGTGLGLFVSYGIIRDHGGNITVENVSTISQKSSNRMGVRFIIELPIIKDKN